MTFSHLVQFKSILIILLWLYCLAGSMLSFYEQKKMVPRHARLSLVMWIVLTTAAGVTWVIVVSAF